jgi:hypothetical protein
MRTETWRLGARRGAYPPQILICEPTLLALLGRAQSLSLAGDELEAVTEQNNLHVLARESCLGKLQCGEANTSERAKVR